MPALAPLAPLAPFALISSALQTPPIGAAREGLLPSGAKL
jgi:hypothetical protein